MADRLDGKVAVITGAASGIGLAAAHAFVGAGAAVVLAGREPTALDEAAAQCGRIGGRAAAAPTDMRSEEQVRALAQRAVDEFGQVDIWVNNAAVTAFGRVEDVPSSVFRGVVETNLFGYLYGIRAILPHFRTAGGGVIVNVNSGVAFACQPGTSSYVATKHALRALSSSLRMELLLEGNDDIHVCDVYPASVDTPLFQHGANFSGHRIHPIPPVHEPAEVADAILRAAARHRRQTFVGIPHRTLLLLQALAPSLSERWIARYVAWRHFSDTPAEDSAGNIAQPAVSHAQMRGGWRKPSPASEQANPLTR